MLVCNDRALLRHLDYCFAVCGKYYCVLIVGAALLVLFDAFMALYDMKCSWIAPGKRKSGYNVCWMICCCC
jgi:hypothetical protein